MIATSLLILIQKVSPSTFLKTFFVVQKEYLSFLIEPMKPVYCFIKMPILFFVNYRQLFFISFTLIINNCFSQVDLNAGLVAYYPFNNNTNDASGNGNNGSATNIAFTTDALGSNNSACYLDGLTSFIEIPSSASLNSTRLLSVAAKFYQEVPGDGNYLLLRGGPFSGGKDMYHLNFSGTPPQNSSFFAVWEPVACAQLIQNQVVSGINTDGELNKWHCVVGVFDGKDVKIYLDGTLRDTRPASFTELEMCDGTYPLFIGRPLRDFYKSFKGKVDEIRIYNRPLTAEEVAAYSDVCGTLVVNTDFDYEVAQKCFPAKIIFKDATPPSGISIVSRVWQFGDGTSSNEKDPTHQYAVAGDYSVTLTLTDVDNKTYTRSGTITVGEPILRFAASTNDTTVCYGQSLTLSATGGIGYRWEPCIALSDCNGATTVAAPLSKQLYTVTVTNTDGCIDTSKVLVDVRGGFASAGPDKVICTGEAATLIATGGVSYLWEPCNLFVDCTAANALLKSNELTNQPFIVHVTDQYGCTDADTVNVSFAKQVGRIFIPASFTPNADGKNDLFKVISEQALPNFHLLVFNRFGEKVFESLDFTKGWDGKIKNSKAPVGTYIYQLTINTGSVQCGDIQRRGSVLLLR